MDKNTKHTMTVWVVMSGRSSKGQKMKGIVPYATRELAVKALQEELDKASTYALAPQNRKTETFICASIIPMQIEFKIDVKASLGEGAQKLIWETNDE